MSSFTYTEDKLTTLIRLGVKTAWASLYLDNSIYLKTDQGASAIKGDADMPERMRQKITVNGQIRWLSGYSTQELFDNYVKLLVNEGMLEWVQEDETIPTFGQYMKSFYDTFKKKQETLTIINRERIAKNHILPAYENRRIDRITTMELQRWFNSLAKNYSHETLLKIKNIMNPVFDAAVEDDIITKNPLASRRIEIGGKETVHHKALPKETMAQIRKELVTSENISWKEKAMAALLCYTGMRFEEVLGVRWEDVTDEYVFVRRAVVHPKRNMPEIKKPKTKTSARQIPLNSELKSILQRNQSSGFILASDKDAAHETPLTYTEARRVFEKIRERFSLESYTAHDFRDTCATEWREKGMPLDVIARILGHSKTETTEKRYVKYRTDLMAEACKCM